MVENLCESWCLLCAGHRHLNIVLGTHALLSLQLQCDEMSVHIFDVANTGKRQLLLHIMAEPLSADGIGEDEGDL